MTDSPMEAVVAVVVIGVITLVGIAVVGQVGAFGASIGTSSGDAEFDPVVDETETLDTDVDEAPRVWSVSLTQGHAIALDGNSHVDASAPDAWPGDGDWTACSVGALHEDANQNAAYALLAVDDETVLIQFDDGEWVGYYDDGEDAARVTLTAETPTEQTPVCLRHNSTSNDVQLHVDGTTSEPVAMDTASRSLSNDWHGAVDEVRFFSVQLDKDQLQQYSNEPAAGLGVEDSARWMFEEGDGDTTSAFYHDDEATLTDGATWTTGVGSPDLVDGEDYERGVDPLSITPLAGGLIDASPVLYVEWDSGVGAAFAAVLSGTGSALQLVPVLLLVLIASIVIAATARLRQ